MAQLSHLEATQDEPQAARRRIKSLECREMDREWEHRQEMAEYSRLQQDEEELRAHISPAEVSLESWDYDSWSQLAEYGSDADPRDRLLELEDPPGSIRVTVVMQSVWRVIVFMWYAVCFLGLQAGPWDSLPPPLKKKRRNVLDAVPLLNMLRSTVKTLSMHNFHNYNRSLHPFLTGYGAHRIHIHIHTHPIPPPAAATSPSEPAQTEPPGKKNRKYGVGAFGFQIVSCYNILELNYVSPTITSLKCPHTWIIYVTYL
ncbi:hypothetical protein B0H13DRAFT_2327132 [Mycena leptocephala]|nr:hypothetical protein B0H13DRAFT_2327132 [Mycena leptocephala]